MPLKISPYVVIHDDGSLEIFGTDKGVMEITAVVPAPDVNTKTEKDRQKKYEEAVDQITVQGYKIISKRMIKNKSFDKKNQKTTLKLVYRPCKTKKEIAELYPEFMKVWNRIIATHQNRIKVQSLTENPDFLECD